MSVSGSFKRISACPIIELDDVSFPYIIPTLRNAQLLSIIIIVDQKQEFIKGLEMNFWVSKAKAVGISY